MQGKKPLCGLNYWRGTGEPLRISLFFPILMLQKTRGTGVYVFLDGS